MAFPKKIRITIDLDTTTSQDDLFCLLSTIGLLNLVKSLLAIFTSVKGLGYLSTSFWSCSGFILTPPLDRIKSEWSLTTFCWLLDTDLYLQHSLHILDGIQVRTLGRPFQNLHSSLIDPFLYHFWCVFGFNVLLKHPNESNTQASGW